MPFQKPETRARTKARKARAEAAVINAVRAACVERDDFCRIYLERSGDTLVNLTDEWYCQGPSEWAHLGDKKRARTMKQAPELRHTTAGSLMLCRRHHRQYDAGKLLITSTTPAGADGPITMSGALITDRILQYKHWLINYVANSGPNSYQAGAWLANPEWPLFDVKARNPKPHIARAREYGRIAVERTLRKAVR